MVASLALHGCVSNAAPSETWADREGASRTYRASDAAKNALQTAEVRALGTDEDQAIIGAYLDDPAHRPGQGAKRK